MSLKILKANRESNICEAHQFWQNLSYFKSNSLCKFVESTLVSKPKTYFCQRSERQDTNSELTAECVNMIIKHTSKELFENYTFSTVSLNCTVLNYILYVIYYSFVYSQSETNKRYLRKFGVIFCLSPRSWNRLEAILTPCYHFGFSLELPYLSSGKAHSAHDASDNKMPHQQHDRLSVCELLVASVHSKWCAFHWLLWIVLHSC